MSIKDRYQFQLTYLLTAFFACGFFFLLPQGVSAATKYWIGSSGGSVSSNSNWSTTSGGSNDTTAPTSSDLAVFSSGNTNNATVDASFGGALGGLQIDSGYSGTVTLQRSLSVAASHFSQAGGTFNLGSTTLTVGTNVSTSNFTVSGGTFTANTGTVTTGGTGAHGFDVVTSLNLYNFTSGGGTVTIASGDTLVVTNNLTFTGGTVNGSGVIEMQGATTTIGSTGTVGTSQVKYLVTGDQTIASGGGKIPGIIVNKSSGTVTQSGSLNVNAGDFLLQSGTYAIGTTTLTLGSDASTVDFTISGGTFNAGTGTVAASTGSGANNVDVNTSQTFYNFTVNRNGGSMTIATGDTLVVTGTLTIGQGTLNGGTIEAQGDVTISSSANGGTTALQFTGSTTTQNFTDNGGTKTSGNITINKSAGEVKLLTAMSYNNTGQTLTITSGTLNLNSFALTVNGALTVSSSGILKLYGAETITRGSLTLSTGSTVLYTGNGDSSSTSYTLTTLATTYSNLTINSTDGATDSFAISATLTVNGTMTITTGTVTGGSNTINVGGNWANAGTFTANTSSVVLTGTSQQISGSTTFYDLTKSVSSSDTLTFVNGTTQTISHTWTMNGASGQLLSLRSNSTNTQWLIDPQSTRTISYLDVQDSYNINATTVSITGLSITNSGNNTGWGFPTASTVTGQNPQTTAGGKSITITGTNFVSTPTVTVGGTSATSITFVSATSLTATAPAKSAGSYDVVVTNPDSSTVTCSSCMTYIAPPTVTSIDQTYASSTGGAPRTITGSGMKVGSSGLVIDPSGTADTVTTSGLSTATTFVAPAHTAGSVIVRVFGTSGTSANGIYTDTSSGFVIYEDMPTFTSIDQPYLPTASPSTRTLTGTNLKVGSAGLLVDGTSVTTSGTASSITFTPPDHAAGSVTVRLYSTNGTDANGLYLDVPSALTYVAKPTISDVSPATGLSTAGGTTITVTGTGMKVGASGAVLDPSGTADVVTTAGSATSATFSTPAHSAGSVTLRVYASNGTTANGLYTDYSSFTFAEEASSNSANSTQTGNGMIFLGAPAYPQVIMKKNIVANSSPLVHATTAVQQKPFLFLTNLEKGMQGSDVYFLQKFLIAFDRGPAARALKQYGATGYFGPLTLSAIKEVQMSLKITPVFGFFGPKTRRAINQLFYQTAL